MILKEKCELAVTNSELAAFGTRKLYSDICHVVAQPWLLASSYGVADSLKNPPVPTPGY
jgi:hypothetical protein